MNNIPPAALTRLSAYRPPAYRIPKLELDFDLFETHAAVRSTLHFECSSSWKPGCALILNGKGPVLRSIRLNDRPLDMESYHINSHRLTILNPPAEGTLSIEAEIHPEKSTDLMGLYRSDGLFCTQNEAEGFRRITWFPDRPDVLSVYTVTIRADREGYPVLLSNGHLMETGRLPEGRHFARWHDPHPKPCYLFALVAGRLECVSSRYRTRSGRLVDIRIFVPPGKGGQTDHAMSSIRSAMRWDEERFGLEYDLDLFMIVAVESLNWGGMENKGLNIYNASYILADSVSADDEELLKIERVIAHEYFHNWTGNRVTCRDWFQLTVKEGLTVYRDEEYISERSSRAGIRIDTVGELKRRQYPDDAGPTAHPIRPEYYLSVDNVYTSTIYQKGKEVIRMLETLTGKDELRRGIIRYLEEFDGRAVRTEDFLDAVEKSSGTDLTLFRRWYGQSGTPEVTVSGNYNGDTREYTLNIRQRGSANPVARGTEVLHIPMKLGLVGAAGRDIPLKLKEPAPDRFNPERSLLHLTKPEESFVFRDVEEHPVPSLFRDFSAPVEVVYPYSDSELLRLLEGDSDPYNRFDAGQRLMSRVIGEIIEGEKEESAWSIDPAVLSGFRRYLDDKNADPAFIARVLTPPDIDQLARKHRGYPIAKTHRARVFFMTCLARFAEEGFPECYRNNETGPYRYSVDANGRRRLKNTCLGYLVLLDEQYRDLAARQCFEADNMSDTLGAAGALNGIRDSRTEDTRDHFFRTYSHIPAALDKWFALQAGAEYPGVVDDILRLERHPSFDRTNLNRIRALYGTFAGNLLHLHHESGSGYTLLSERILAADSINPQAAADMSKAFRSYPLLDSPRRESMRKAVQMILEHPSLSDNVFEVIQKIEEA